MKRRFVRSTAALALGCSALACNSATVRSGLAPADTAPRHHDKWHASFLFGTLEASGPYSLSRLCPDGWAEIKVGPDPFTLLAGALTLFVYSPTRVTVVCAAKGAQEPPAVGDGAAETSAEGRGGAPTPPPPGSF